MSQQRIGRYQILEEIASGGQATVYRVWDTQTGSILALKVMHPHLTRDTSYVERFKREHADLPVEHPDYCCGDSKVEATQRALQGLRGWITGISRSDSTTRAATPLVEVLNTGLTKISPLAAWSPKELHAYMSAHDLPYHPLWAQGYTSVGCYPCTQRPTDPNDPRSGRWAGEDKTECGIHDIGKLTPT